METYLGVDGTVWCDVCQAEITAGDMVKLIYSGEVDTRVNESRVLMLSDKNCIIQVIHTDCNI